MTVNDSVQVAHLFGIFNTIKGTSSKKSKVEVIATHKEDKAFQILLHFLYDDLISSGLSTKKINKDVEIEESLPKMTTLIELIEYIKTNNTGTDKDIAVAQGYVNSIQDEDIQGFVKNVLTKNVKVGITANSVNKAYGYTFVREFKVMLAHRYEKYVEKLDETFYITTKLDGHRTIVFYDGGNVEFRTRNGHLIEGLDEIERDIKALFTASASENVVLDGEIIAAGLDPKEDDVYKETSKKLRRHGRKDDVEFHIFDMLPREEFDEGTSTLGYADRRDQMTTLFATKEPKADVTVKLVDTVYVGDDKSVIPNLLAEAIDNGEEGLMLNTGAGLYSNKRTKDILKIKQFYDDDVLVTGVFEGTGKYENKMGGVVISYKGYEVKVGSGWSDADREYYWNNQQDILGQVIEVQHFGESTNSKNDDISLRFPTFSGRVRTDKKPEQVTA